MRRTVLLCSSTLLLFFVISFVHGQSSTADWDSSSSTAIPASSADPGSTQNPSSLSSTKATKTTAKKRKTTKKYRDPNQSGSGSKNKMNGQGGYDDVTYDVIGNDGKDPRKFGSDTGDFGPVYNDKQSMLSSLDFWIYADEDDEGDEGDDGYDGYDGDDNNGGTQGGGQGTGRGSGGGSRGASGGGSRGASGGGSRGASGGGSRGGSGGGSRGGSGGGSRGGSGGGSRGGSRGGSGKGGASNQNNKDSRKKRSYSQVRFPVKQIRNYRDFPTKRFPPLISIFPWVPIFYDKLTYQTIIFSPTGGIYIIPPLINFYGQRFAVAQLIKWGYASLVSSGVPVGPGVDVAPLVQPPPPPGGPAPVGVVGGAGGVGGGVAPTYNANKVRFNGGVKTDFPSFKPRYSQTLEEGGDSGYGRPSKPSYGGQSDYGGTRNQQVYAQGGPKYPSNNKK